MRDKSEREKILEALKEGPVVKYALSKTQVPRSTFYRWLKKPKFKKKVDDAKKFGRDQVSDVAESHLIKKVNEGDTGSVKYWLETHADGYKKRRNEIRSEEKEDNKINPDGPVRLADALKREFNFGKTMANIDIAKLKIEITARRAMRNMPPEGMAEEILFALTASRKTKEEKGIL